MAKQELDFERDAINAFYGREISETTISSAEIVQLGTDRVKIRQIEAALASAYNKGKNSLPLGKVLFRCDGCGKIEAGHFRNGTSDALKPADWYIRGDLDGTQISCSRDCISAIAKKTGKTSVVLPI